MNVEKSRLDKMLANAEIRSLVIAIGAAIGQDFDITKARYHKIIIMTDADVDGAHIRTLLMTLFYRYFHPMVAAGYVYAAQPPLFKLQQGKEIRYAYSAEEQTKVLKEMEKKGTVSVSRYKGLGEMNPDQLWETTMSPENRVLKQINIDDAEAADHLFDILMGDEVEPRKQFIQTHATKVQNLDV